MVKTRIERKVNGSKYFSVTLLTILVFIVGILFGNYIANSKLNELGETQQKLTAQIMGLDIKEDLLKNNNICALTWNEIWKEKVETGKKIEELEKRFGKENTNVLIQKEVYHLIELKTWLLLKEIKEECGDDINTILYFYTNQEEDPKGSQSICETQGYVLDGLYQKYGDKINTFVFDVNIENPALNILKQIYNIETVPTIVINGEVYEGLVNFPTIEEILELK